MATHYERLGVAPSASTEEVRTAYRALARRLHPDRLGDVTDAERRHADRRIREVNESWAVLQDPARRRTYDDGRLGASRRPPASRPSARSVAPVHVDDDDLVDVLPDMTAVQAGLFRHLPWVVLVAVFVLLFVVTAYAKTSNDPAPPERGLVAGDCAVVANADAVTVPCGEAHDVTIVSRAGSAADCSPPTQWRRFGDRQFCVTVA